MMFFLLKGLFLHISIDHSHQKSCPRNNHLNQALALWSLDENLLMCTVMPLCLSLLLQGISAHTKGQWERISFGRNQLKICVFCSSCGTMTLLIEDSAVPWMDTAQV